MSSNKGFDNDKAWAKLKRNGFYPTKYQGSPCFLSRVPEVLDSPHMAVMTVYRLDAYLNMWTYRTPIQDLLPYVRDNLPPVRNMDGSIVT